MENKGLVPRQKREQAGRHHLLAKQGRHMKYRECWVLTLTQTAIFQNVAIKALKDMFSVVIKIEMR